MNKKILQYIECCCFVALITIETVFVYCFFQKDPPTISVVLPTYNRADTFLTRAIDGVLDQTFTDFELLIVDDGSTDHTKELVHAYMKKDKRIRYLNYGSNRGVAYAREYGNNRARGKYIAVMDSDDVVFSHWLEKMYDFAVRNPDIDIIIPYKRAYYEHEDEDITTGGRSYNFPLAINFFSNAFQNVGILFQRKFIEKHNIHYKDNLTHGEDWEFWLEMGYAGARASYTDFKGPLLFVRVHRSNSYDYYHRIHRADKMKILYHLYHFLGIPKNKKDDKCFVFEMAKKKMPHYIPLKDWEKGQQIFCSPEEDKEVDLEHEGKVLLNTTSKDAPEKDNENINSNKNEFSRSKLQNKESLPKGLTKKKNLKKLESIKKNKKQGKK